MEQMIEHDGITIRCRVEGRGPDLMLVHGVGSNLDAWDGVVAALKSDEPVAAITELEREALTEIGNIILNACLSSFGDLLEREVATSLPRYVSGSSGAVFDGARGFDLGLVVKVDFNVEGRDIEGYVTFVLNVDSVAAFREAASRLLDRLH